MDSKKFTSSLFQINNPGRLASLKRIFGHGGSEVTGLKVLAQMGVSISDPDKSLPYKIVSFIYGRGVPNGRCGNLAMSLKSVAIKKEGGSNENGDLSFDKRFDALVACRTQEALKNHLVKLVTFLDEGSVNYEILLEDLINWSSVVRDKWIETYYKGAL